MDKDEMKTVIVAWAIIIAIGALACTGLIFLEKAVNDDSDWAKDTADKLDRYGGSIKTVDDSSIVIYAHCKPTTHVEYKNNAFYITDPNNGYTGLIVLPLEKVSRVYTQED